MLKTFLCSSIFSFICSTVPVTGTGTSKETMDGYTVIVDELERKRSVTPHVTPQETWSDWWQRQRTKVLGAMGIATLGCLYMYTSKNQNSISNLPTIKQ